MNQITHLKTVNFMGKNIDEHISQKMVYIGENTSGKSSRTIAITLCLLGFIPYAAKPAKKAGDILKDFGNGDFMSVEITCNDHKFERSFVKSKKGVVSQKLTFDGKKTAKGTFEVELYKSEAPRIIDVDTFIKSSDTERISTLFKLYPPDGDICILDSFIEIAKSKISGLNEKIGQCEATVKSNTDTKTAIEMPVGTLAETQKEIVDLTEKINVARKELNAENIRLATEEGEKNASNHVEKQEQSKFNTNVNENSVPLRAGTGSHIPSNQTKDYPRAFRMEGPQDNPVVSIQKIIDAMESAGCQICAGLMVAKDELRKYKEGGA